MARKLIPGVYRITNTITGDSYVGSSRHVYDRWHEHRRALRKGIHINSYLQRAWDKHGEDAFVHSVLEECSLDVVIEREQHWIDMLLPAYNLRKIADRSGSPGPETIQKMRETRKVNDANGIPHGGPPKGVTPHIEKLQQLNTGRKIQRSPETARKIAETQRGRKRSPEAVAKSAAGNRGKKLTEEHKEAIRRFQTGRRASAETREKLRQSHLGQRPTPETREKNRQAQLGRKASPETREKIRQSKLGKKRNTAN